jgi:hypothetical protein
MSWHRHRSRWLCYLALGCLVLVASLMAIAVTRNALLRSAGRLLAVQDGVPHADIIVISIDADGAGVLEAADLVHGGTATRVAVFPDPPAATDLELARRGAPYHDAAVMATLQLHALGVSTVDLIPFIVNGTTDEGVVLERWCAARGFRTVLFISTSDHSRRSRRMLERAMRNSGTRVIVHYSRYSNFDPDNWWRTRNGIRIELIEGQKLLADVLRHPFS